MLHKRCRAANITLQNDIFQELVKKKSGQSPNHVLSSCKNWCREFSNEPLLLIEKICERNSEKTFYFCGIGGENEVVKFSDKAYHWSDRNAGKCRDLLPVAPQDPKYLEQMQQLPRRKEEKKRRALEIHLGEIRWDPNFLFHFSQTRLDNCRVQQIIDHTTCKNTKPIKKGDNSFKRRGERRRRW